MANALTRLKDSELLKMDVCEEFPDINIVKALMKAILSVADRTYTCAVVCQRAG